MRAAVVTRFGGPEVIETQDVPVPVAGPGQVVLDVELADIIFVETQIRRGLHDGFFNVTPPYVPGSAVGGRVRAVGPDVDAELVGRTVVGRTVNWGGHAEQAVLAAEELIDVPAGLSLREAVAVFGDGTTAFAALGMAPIRPGSQVLITAAAGGMGVLLVQLAHAAGAKVVAAARGEAKLDLVRKLGADVVIDYSRPGWEKLVVEATGDGPQVVFEGAGGELGKEAFETVAPGGWISAHGAPSGGFAEIDEERAGWAGITVQGIRELQLDPAAGRAAAERALAETAAGRIAPVIDRTFALEDVRAAHEAIEARALVGKALIIV